MDEQRSKVRLYFSRFPQWTLPVLAVGLIVVLVADTIPGRMAGVGAIILAAAMGVRWYRARPNDEDMDTWLRQDVQDLEPRALTKSGLDVTELVRDKVVVIGPRFRELGGAEFGFRKGGDDQARFTPVGVTIINFTEHQLVAYQCVLDLTTGKPLNECVDEYFYKDIVSVSTKAEAVTYDVTELDRRLLSRIPDVEKSAVNGKIQVNSAESFVLSTSGGNSVRVVLNDPVLIKGLGGGDVPLQWAEEAVQAVRMMLRSKARSA